MYQDFLRIDLDATQGSLGVQHHPNYRDGSIILALTCLEVIRMFLATCNFRLVGSLNTTHSIIIASFIVTFRGSSTMIG